MVKIVLNVEVDVFKEWDGLDNALKNAIKHAVEEYSLNHAVEIVQKINYKTIEN